MNYVQNNHLWTRKVNAKYSYIKKKVPFFYEQKEKLNGKRKCENGKLKAANKRLFSIK